MEDVGLVNFETSQPIYSVRGKTLTDKVTHFDRSYDNPFATTPFQVDYDEEDIFINESALLHIPTGALQLMNEPPSTLYVSLEIKEKEYRL